MSRDQAAAPVPSLVVPMRHRGRRSCPSSVRGDAVLLPEEASTPLALRLNPGDYRVVLQGPPPQLDNVQSVFGRARRGSHVARAEVRHHECREYFRPYLLPAAPVVAPAAPVEEVSP